MIDSNVSSGNAFPVFLSAESPACNFVIENLEYFPENELIIFNRWGDIVYEAAPYLNDWSGQVNGAMILTGTEVPDGTYFYVLKLSPEDDNPLKGDFELRRK